jgi:putative component of toxin-antitoxin plasmid stabilization module
MSYTIKQLPQFSCWLKGLKDSLTCQRLIKRLRKVSLGNRGDVAAVGDESAQQADIGKAMDLANSLEGEPCLKKSRHPNFLSLTQRNTSTVKKTLQPISRP